jgi:hypothetical protein
LPLNPVNKKPGGLSRLPTTSDDACKMIAFVINFDNLQVEFGLDANTGN